MSIRRTIVSGLLALGVSLAASPFAQAAVKDAALGSFGGGQLLIPIGVAVDQSSGDVYVGDLLGGNDKFDSSRNLLAPPSPFGAGSGFYSGVAVDPTNHDVDVIDALSQTIDTYDPTSGALLSSFPVPGTENIEGAFTVVQIATDAAGNVYVPNAPSNEIQVFDPSGGTPNGVAATITGSGANTLSAPTGVAVDSSGDIWVADDGNGRIEEFEPNGTFVKEIASPGVRSLAIDTNGNIYAGANSGSGFHVVLYSSTGVQLTEFGLGTIGSSEFGSVNAIAIDQETGSVYVTDAANNVVWVYGPPLVLPDVSTSTPATSVTASTATISGAVNPDETSVSGCRFEYGFSTTYLAAVPCSVAPPLTGSAPIAQSVSLAGLQPGKTYHYRLVAGNANGTTDGEDQTLTTPPSIPSLDEVSASAVTQTSAILDASVNPNNQDTTYHFDFGAGATYGRTLPVPDADIGSGYGDVGAGQPVSGLQPATTYHFRVLATNATGTATGVDETFTTLPPTPPIVNTGQAGEVTQSAATLSGTVDPQDVQSTYEFDLGTDTGYGSRIFGDAGAGSASQTFTVRVNGLASGTTYHYRILATNVFGTTYGSDQTFTTPVVPSSLLVAPSTVTLVPTPLIGIPPAQRKTTITTSHKQKTKKQKAKKQKAKKQAKAKRAIRDRRGK
jgi:streptogramin lyase